MPAGPPGRCSGVPQVLQNLSLLFAIAPHWGHAALTFIGLAFHARRARFDCVSATRAEASIPQLTGGRASLAQGGLGRPAGVPARICAIGLIVYSRAR